MFDFDVLLDLEPQSQRLGVSSADSDKLQGKVKSGLQAEWIGRAGLQCPAGRRSGGEPCGFATNPGIGVRNPKLPIGLQLLGQWHADARTAVAVANYVFSPDNQVPATTEPATNSQVAGTSPQPLPAAGVIRAGAGNPT